MPLNKPLKFHAKTIVLDLFLKKVVDFICNIFQMTLCMYYKNARIEKLSISEAVDTNKTSASKECMLCHYWYFKDVGFKFVNGVGFRCILWGY